MPVEIVGMFLSEVVAVLLARPRRIRGALESLKVLQGEPLVTPYTISTPRGAAEAHMGRV